MYLIIFTYILYLCYIASDDDHDMNMNAAIKSLRFALAHPLTNYNEVPSKGFLPPKDYVRPTENSTLQKLPRIVKKEKVNKKKKGKHMYI